MDIKPTHQGSRHCGAVKFEVHIPDGLVALRFCNCSVCGIYTHHQQRAGPDHFGFNVGCLAGIDPYALGDIPVYDGVNRPSDRGSFE